MSVLPDVEVESHCPASAHFQSVVLSDQALRRSDRMTDRLLVVRRWCELDVPLEVAQRLTWLAILKEHETAIAKFRPLVRGDLERTIHDLDRPREVPVVDVDELQVREHAKKDFAVRDRQQETLLERPGVASVFLDEPRAVFACKARAPVEGVDDLGTSCLLYTSRCV